MAAEMIGSGASGGGSATLISRVDRESTAPWLAFLESAHRGHGQQTIGSFYCTD
jgi:hypothetical protein